MMYSKKPKETLKSLLYKGDPIKRQVKQKEEEEKVKKVINKNKLKRNMPKIGGK